jgi:hypothetical protein
MSTNPTTTMRPRTSCPLPVGCEIYLTCEPRGWRGELADGPFTVEARADTPEAVLAKLRRLYQAGGKDPLLA